MKILKLIKKYPKIDSYFLFISTLFIYVHNLSPSVYGGDSGDLLSAVLTKGVPHPSGYPLFTMLGILFQQIPISATPAWKVGLVSAFFSSLSVVVVYLIIRELLKSRYLAIVTSLTLAFLYPFWLYAEIVEVLALNSFFILILVFLTIKYIGSKKIKYFYILAFFAGLSLTNNMTIVLLFPSIAITILWTNKKILLNFSALIKSAFLFVLGLTPYIYIPIAARNNPLYNWGMAVNLENLIYMVLRKDYGWGIALKNKDKILNIVIEQFKNYFTYWKTNITILIPITAFLGIAYLVIRKKYKLLFFLLASYFFLGPFYLAYSRSNLKSFLVIATYEKFYIAGFIFVIIIFAHGLAFVQQFVSKIIKKKNTKYLVNKIVLATFFIVPITSLLTNFQKTDLSNIYIGDNFAIDILSPLPENSVVLLRGDHEHFNSVYVQEYYGLRKDVHLAGRHNGFEDLLQSLGMNDEEIRKHKIKNKSAIELKTYYAAIASLTKKGNFFTDSKIGPNEIYEEELGKIKYIPYGLFYKLEFENSYKMSRDEYLAEMEKLTFSFHLKGFSKNKPVIENSLMYADIQSAYASAFYRIAKFLSTEYQDHKSSAIFLDKALEIDPLFIPEAEN